MKKLSKLFRILQNEWVDVHKKVCCRSCMHSDKEFYVFTIVHASSYLYWNYPANIVDTMDRIGLKYEWDGDWDKAIKIIED